MQKGRTGENAPTFAVEVVYLQRSSEWTAKGDARLELPAVDLPVSRSGVLVHYSPRFKVEPQAGTFRREERRRPMERRPPRVRRRSRHDGSTGSSACSGKSGRGRGTLGGRARAEAKVDTDSTQTLVDRFRKDMGRTTVGVVPVRVIVPDIGPSFFVTAELTAEAQSPALDLRYTRTARF